MIDADWYRSENLYGQLGELKAQEIMLMKGYHIYEPKNCSSVSDFIAEKDGEFYRVQSKMKQVYQASACAKEKSRQGSVRLDLRRNRRKHQSAYKQFYDLDYINIFTLYVPDIEKVLFFRKADFQYITPRGTKPTSLQIRVHDIEKAQKNTRNSCVRPYHQFVSPSWLDTGDI